MKKLGLFTVIGLISLLSENLLRMAEDDKITITEGIELLSKICQHLGLDFDDKGVDLTKLYANMRGE